MDCSPGEHPHSDRPNFTLEDYLAMCEAGEAEYSLSEVARLMGVSRMNLHRWMIMASVTDEEFEAVLADFESAGKRLSTTAIADEIKRRTGRARAYEERCPAAAAFCGPGSDRTPRAMAVLLRKRPYQFPHGMTEQFNCT